MLSATDVPLLGVLAAVVRRGSFTAAAAELKLSKSVVSERIKQLEERCGARLLERTTRRMRLTSAGEEVVGVAREVEDALGTLSRRLDLGRSEPAGLLRVATTADLGPLLIGPVVGRFVAKYPKMRVEVIADDAPCDLLEAGVDVAVRLGAPSGPSTFFARKLAVLAEPIVAAPAVAGLLGPVSRPRELAQAPWVRHTLVSGVSLRFHGPHGATDEIAPQSRAEANSGATVLSLLLHGAGVGVLPEHALREHLRSGRLVDLCPGWTWKHVTLYALTPSKPSSLIAVGAFVAMLEEQVELDRSRFAMPGGLVDAGTPARA